MSGAEPRWQFAAPGVAEIVASWLSSSCETRGAGEIIAENEHRRLIRVSQPGERGLLIKHFRLSTGPHPLREWAKSALGRSAPTREWGALRSLRAAGLAVPEPLGFAQLADGDQVVVEELLAGENLWSLLRSCPGPHRDTLLAAGALVRRLHSAGFAHGDLHPGNLVVTPRGPVLIDLQRTRRASPTRCLRDLGLLDYALAQCGISRCDRVRVRRVALGLDCETNRAGTGPALATDATNQRGHVRSTATGLHHSDHDALRAIGGASRLAAQRHQRERTRQCLRAGGRFEAFRRGHASGLRLVDVDPALLEAVLADRAAAMREKGGRAAANSGPCSSAAIAVDGRQFVVHEYLERRSRPSIRGWRHHSAARRAWQVGHGLVVRGIDTLRPLAFVDAARGEHCPRSLLVLEDVCAPHVATATLRDARDAAELADILSHLLVQLHDRGVLGADLGAAGTRVHRCGGQLRPTLLATDAIQFRRTPSPRLRAIELARLDAILQAAHTPEDSRERARRHYLQRLPLPASDQP